MNVFFIFPHPDDETIFAGGTIMRHIRSGDNVIWVCASYGERGGESRKRSSFLFYLGSFLLSQFPLFIHLQTIIPKILGRFRKQDRSLLAIRKKEAQQVARFLGISKIIFLEIEDMKFENVQKELEGRLAILLLKHKPQLIYTMHNNGVTGHPDHIILSKVVTRVVHDFQRTFETKVFGVGYESAFVRRNRLPFFSVKQEEIEIRNVLYDEELDKKLGAIRLYGSQEYLWKRYLRKNKDAFQMESFVRMDH